MKKKLAGIACLALAGALALGGCDGAAAGVKLSYDDQIHPDLNNAFIEELFYRNDLGTMAPDPCVIKITDKESTEYGKYYLYGTTDPNTGYRAYCNDDLTGEWVDMTSVKNFLAFEAPQNHYAYGKGSFWAPEVIYDEADDLYYMFYSGTVSGSHRAVGVAVAEEPYGPFVPATTDGLNAATPLLENSKMQAWAEANGEPVGSQFNSIDPHPYVAPDGTKYLYFSHEYVGSGGTSDILGVVMETWTKPDFSTMTVLTRAGFYTADNKSADNVPTYENNNIINEGPWMTQVQLADGSWQYHLLLSVNGYSDKSYSVVQAVGNSPLGPFRKLTEEEGGLLVHTDGQRFDHVSGTGHNSIVQIENELWIVYHEHVARETGGDGERDVAMDRLVWTKNENGLDVLYCNGPTWSLQPRPEAHSEYKNLARDAKITVTSGENVGALNDGIFSLYNNINYVKEYELSKDATITISFDDYREVTALMVYNSKIFENTFVDVTRIELDFEYEGQKGMAYIDNLAFNWDFYKMSTTNEMRPGGSAVAVFNPLKVKEIRFKFVIPNTRPEGLEIMDEEGYFIKQAKIGISEIVVLGK